MLQKEQDRYVEEVAVHDEYTPWPLDVAELYQREGYWTGETLGELPTKWANEFGDRTAIVGDGRALTYRELDTHSTQLAQGFLACGINSGDTVVVHLPNIIEFFEVLFGLFKTGAIPVLVPPAYRKSEITYFCHFTGAVAYVVTDKHDGFDFGPLSARVYEGVPTLRHVIVAGEAGPFTSLDAVRVASGTSDDIPKYVKPENVALLHLSGGTTGTPKLVPRTHNDYLYAARASAEVCGFTAATAYLCCLPSAHLFPLGAPGALGTFLVGGRVVLASNPTPEVTFPLIEREHVTVTALVPPLVNLWLEAAHRTRMDLSSLRLLQVGGAKLLPQLARLVGPTLGCLVQQVFGMTEGQLNFTRLDDSDEAVCTTQGRPLSPRDEIRLIDDDGNHVAPGEPGHLLVRGPTTIRGYYRAAEYNAQTFTADGFYRTGDIVQKTPTGHLVVVGRAKDQINRGGVKIAAEEVENHLLAHPDVSEAAVVAMPDQFLGERICAFIVASNRDVGRADVMTFIRGRGIASHKVPDCIEFIDELPRTALGKISKKDLRSRAAIMAAEIEEA
ncbi:(2,3-dihydroxybenzoyl)adenylate synthase [Streptomyces chartreusis]|uniref:(2,3-dihydroxybenzoyl)adenylate synthase n=1 Tax=Streptomyces chartreusis TaxID=1969 RepID=UPI0037F5C7C5